MPNDCILQTTVVLKPYVASVEIPTLTVRPQKEFLTSVLSGCESSLKMRAIEVIAKSVAIWIADIRAIAVSLSFVSRNAY